MSRKIICYGKVEHEEGDNFRLRDECVFMCQGWIFQHFPGKRVKVVITGTDKFWGQHELEDLEGNFKISGKIHEVYYGEVEYGGTYGGIIEFALMNEDELLCRGWIFRKFLGEQIKITITEVEREG